MEDAAVMFDFFQSGDATESELKEQYDITLKNVEELEFKNMLSSEEDQLNAVMQITAGAGGTESCDWASMLLRMYVMWGEKHGFKVTEQDYQEGDVAGIKTVTIQFEGNFAATKQKMISKGINEPSDAAVFAVMNKSLSVGGTGRNFFESFKLLFFFSAVCLSYKFISVIHCYNIYYIIYIIF